MNGNTDLERAPVYMRIETRDEEMKRVCGLRERIGPKVEDCLSKMDVKDAFRRIHIDWDKSSVFRI